ncbi:MAG: hypothetical protein HY901_15735 [Deltaproteobacteria bacterium]|nr:hypothetical protein [Deltaproteobacteria bacterium]
MRSLRRIAFAVASLASLAGGCSCNEEVPIGGQCTDNADCASGLCVDGVCQTPGAVDAGGNDGADAALACHDLGAACDPQQAPPCCSGICRATDGGTPTCRESSLCQQQGSSCTDGTECCSQVCTSNKCAGGMCKPIGEGCAEAGDCCSTICTAGLCAQIPNSVCKNLGEVCAASGDCCSKNCQGGRCVRAAMCSAEGDLCLEALDCCNGTCNLPAAGGPGLCAVGWTAPGATGCIIGGEPCSDSGNCCSHLCEDLGSGQSTCVLGSGCRERGEICQGDGECCGTDTSEVTCSKTAATDLVGRCANPHGCAPVGNCCGAFGDNCRQACCNGHQAVCKLDSQGLSRCFGGCTIDDECSADCPNGYDGLDPDCCIAEGQECQFRDQCCDMLPCIQDGTGKYVCQAPTCTPAGQSCTPGTSICCNGLSCEPSGEIGFICRTSSVTPGGADGGVTNPSGDGGTVGPGYDAGPTCAANSAACTLDGQCCSGLCLAGVCASCKANGAGCTAPGECCSGLCTNGTCDPGATCVSQGGACSGTSECCPGFACDVPAGAANGTCQPGASCPTTGQNCSTTQACCQGLACFNAATGDPCASGDPRCTCHIVIN